jgi:hypothetical protein
MNHSNLLVSINVKGPLDQLEYRHTPISFLALLMPVLLLLLLFLFPRLSPPVLSFVVVGVVVAAT